LESVPTVLATFTAAKYFVWVGFLVTGVRFQPVRRLLKRPGPKRLRDNFVRRYPEFYSRNEKRILAGAEVVAKSRWFEPIGRRLTTNQTHAALGLAEGMLCYKVFFPIHAPLTLWVVASAYATGPHDDSMGYIDEYNSLRRISNVESTSLSSEEASEE